MSTTTITISTHVLDTSLGRPAEGIPATLEHVDAEGVPTLVAWGTTNPDGRIPALIPTTDELVPGTYRLCFDVAPYFAASRRQSFFTEICVAFQVAIAPQHYHVPLLLSPFGYSTYRGS